VALQAIEIMSAAGTRAALRGELGAATTHHLLLPCRHDLWFTDFSATRQLLAEGASAARSYLADAANHT